MVVAIIGDIVDSRGARSRMQAHDDLLTALSVAAEMVPFREEPAPTVGDEFQGLCDSMSDAVYATLLIRSALPENLDVRFGLGLGDSQIIDTEPAPGIRDGSAWWNARSAINDVEQLARKMTGVRTRANPEREHVVLNAYLACRDELVTAWTGRQRRIALGLCEGRTQRELAETEGVSQSAISQAIRRGAILSVLQRVEDSTL